MSRRRGTPRGGRRAAAGLPPAPAAVFAITSVPQKEGKIAGGTTVTITASSIVGSPTCDLGSLAAPVGNTMVWTSPDRTAAGPGTFTVTVTNGDGHTDTFSYKALRAPVLPTTSSPIVSPTHGPATLTNAGLLCSAMNIPSPGSGCPMSLRLGAGVSNSEVPIGPAAYTCNMGAPGAGSLSAQLFVDGVGSNVVAAAYTGDAAPSINFVVGVGTAGGSTNVNGAAFVNGIFAEIFYSSAWHSVTTTFGSSTTCTIVVPTLTVGSYPVRVTNPDGQVSASSSVEVSTSETIETILSTRVAVDLNFDLSTVVSGIVTAVPDQSGNGKNGSPVGSPVFNTVDPDGNYQGGPSVSLDGSTQAITVPSFPLSTNTLTILFAGMIYSDNGSSQIFATVKTATSQELLMLYLTGGTGVHLRYVSSGSEPIWSPNFYGVPFIAAGTDVGSASTNNALSLSIDGQTAQTATKTGQLIPATSATAAVGERLDGTSRTRMTLKRLVVVDGTITAGELTRCFTSINLQQRICPLPTMTAVMPVLAGTASTTSRFVGTNLPGSGLAVSIVVGGTVYPCTVTWQDTTSVDFTLPASPTLTAGQSYDLILDNGIGTVVTFSGALQATSSQTIQTVAGNALVAAWMPDDVQQTSNNVTSILDSLSLLGQTLNVVSGTAPVWDGTKKSRTYTSGSSTFCGRSSLDLRATTPGCTIITICKPANNTGTQVIASYGNVQFALELASGKPRPNAGTAWGSTIGTQAHRVEMTIASGTNPSASINVDEGTAVTSTLTLAAATNKSWFAEGANWANATPSANSFLSGAVQATLFYNRALTTGEVAAIAADYVSRGYPAL